MSTTVCTSFYQIVVCVAKQKFNLVYGAFSRSSERILIWCSFDTKEEFSSYHGRLQISRPY